MERDQAFKFVEDLLKLMIQRGGSDLFLSANFPPAMKVDGKMTKISAQILTSAHTKAMARSLMSDKHQKEFESTKECNFSVAPVDVGRFRANAFIQQGCVSLVLRTIPMKIPTFKDLKIPKVLEQVALEKRGLVLFVGSTGSGKSTSMAAMINHRNEHSFGHIITIEDPVEFVHTNKNCLISQRDVGIDTDGWAIALKNTLRQAPDVILIGEIRDRETMEHAMAFAETGHLCLATLHANNANQAIDRIINFFPEDARGQLLQDLSLNMKAMISQRLMLMETGKGRAAAVEILLNTPLIADLINKGAISDIKELIKRSREVGMQTFDQSIFDIYESGAISMEEGIRHADSVNDLRLQFKLNSKRNSQSSKDLMGSTGNMAII